MATGSLDELGQDEAVSTSLIIINGFLVFFMQIGFLALETGSGRSKNVRNILLKNLLDVMLAALVWWAVGFAFAYGKSARGVIGTTHFFYEGERLADLSVRPWFFSWTFCIAACTIISGCLAERTALVVYPVATFAIAAIVHPLLVHWIWHPQGFINNITRCGVLDFAGGMVVHMLGGLFGLVGAYICGPRLGRFELSGTTAEGDESCQQFLDVAHQGDHFCAARATGRAAGASVDPADSASELTGSSPASNTSVPEGPSVPAGIEGTYSCSPSLALQQQQQQGNAACGDVLHRSQGDVTHVVEGSSASSRTPMSRGAGSEGSEVCAEEEQQQGCESRCFQATPISGAVELQPSMCPLQDSSCRDIGPACQSEDCTRKAAGPRGSKDVSTLETDGSSRRRPQGRICSRVHQPLQQHQQGQQQGQQQCQCCQCRSRGPPKQRWGASCDPGTSAASCGRGICRFVPKAMPGHDMAFVTLGTFMLWFGWFGFNNGSVYMYISTHINPAARAAAGALSAEVVQRTSMNTALGGAAAGLSALLCAAIFWGTYDLRICCNGVLTGLVIVTCMCGFVDPWAAVVCSALAGAAYTGASWALLRCGIDDPLDSSAVHFGSSVLGSIMVAFVANPKHVQALTGSVCGGIFYGRNGWMQLGVQLLGIAVVVVFAGGVAWLVFWILKKAGLLRVDQVTELAGLDNMEHGGPAYPEHATSWVGQGFGSAHTLSAGRRSLA